jgi:UDP-N-acetylglucosamine--N-acetylmuramyl-(pentapeptide) pyrophosphoryl-undecaprenol N-acetylglucosamine transferase
LTGGGTAGHVTPHLALIPHLQRAGYEIHYIGTEAGMERDMISRLNGITYHAVKGGKLRRYFSWKNFTDPFRVLWGAMQSARLMGKLKPDVCFSKGGFVSVPVVFGAWLYRVPVVLHESDFTPGLANRICARFAKRIATTFPECAKALGEKAQMTGTPLRPELFSGSRAKGLAMGGFSGQKPILLMMGGSSGAQSVNQVLREVLPRILPMMDVTHICGKGNLDADLSNTPGYWQKEFLSEELPNAFAAADLILSRAGSNALCEFQALKKPMLLIPYPRTASRGDQILNAKSYQKRGLCHVLLQEDLTVDSLVSALHHLYESSADLRKALESAPAADGTRAVLDMIEEVQGSPSLGTTPKE